MSIKLFSGLFAGIALVASTIATATPTKTCCELQLACCQPASACCATDAKPGCCRKALACCAADKGCCDAARKCCAEGKACCDKPKSCCGAKDAAAKANVTLPVENSSHESGPDNL